MATEDEQGVVDEVKEKVSNGNGGGNALVSALTSKELILPAVLSAAGAVAAAKGPDLVRKLSENAEQKSEEEAENLGKRAVSGVKESLGGGPVGKLLGGGGGSGGGGGGKKTRRLPIQRWTDVAVPVEDAYEAWTDFDKFPSFMHRVQNVEEEGKDSVKWQEKIWFSTRQWEGRIIERRKNDRIVWKTTSGTNHHGVVTFHKLDARLTRVMVDMEFEPSGMLEKMASGMRFAKRAVQADLARFKAYVEFEDAKGLEYRQGGGEDEEDQPKAQQEDSSRGDGDDGGGDDERDAEREKREQAREERRRERTESK